MLIADKSFMDKLGRTLQTYGFVLLALIFIAAPIVASADYFVVHVLHFKAINGQGRSNLKHLLEKHYYLILIYGCLIGPILEETVFRLPLSFKKNNIALGIACAVLLFGFALKGKILIAGVGILVVVLIRIAIAIATFFIVRRLLPNDIQLSDATKKWLIVLSISLFGLMHIANFTPIQWPIIGVYPLYVVPQIFMGWLITYVRFKNGFIWGIALHCLINSVALGLVVADKESVKTKSSHTVTIKAKADSGLNSVKASAKEKNVVFICF